MSRTKSVAVQMQKILEEFSDKVEGVLKSASEETSEEAVQKLQNSSPVKTGDYARGWRVSVRGGLYVVHNATDYQLTHLLENGHVIRNKKGTYGRTSGIKHIKPVERWANKEFQRKIEEGLK